MEQHPDTADNIVKAACILHNMLQSRNAAVGQDNEASGQDHPSPDISGQHSGSQDMQAGALQPIQRLRGNRASREAFVVRDSFRDYFMSDFGKVPWQSSVLE